MFIVHYPPFPSSLPFFWVTTSYVEESLFSVEVTFSSFFGAHAFYCLSILPTRTFSVYSVSLMAY